jgi:hypothetical protein
MNSMVHLPREGVVRADVNYLVNAPGAGEPLLEFHTENEARNTMRVLPGRRVPIADARTAGEAFTLEANGFQLCHAPTAIGDFTDIELNAALTEQYCKEIERFILELTGGARAIVRRESVRNRYGENRRVDLPNTRPVRHAHADNTDSSAVGRALDSAVRDLQANGVEFDPGDYSRFAHYNTWRCVSPPPQDVPLAVCDARSVAPADEVTVRAISATARHGDIVHDITTYSYSPRHRWYYFRDMTRDELLVFVQHDSQRELRRVPHTAFDDPSCPPGATPRNSVEARATVFFK